MHQKKEASYGDVRMWKITASGFNIVGKVRRVWKDQDGALHSNDGISWITVFM